jgi:putative FmdB family regulatory protein
MPLYEYECDACHHRFEVIQKYSDSPKDTCPKCGGPVHKLQSAPSFQFKGTGWYVTDYAKKDQGGSSKTGDSSSESKGSSESSEKSEKSEKIDKSDKSEKSEKSEKSDKSGGDSAKSSGDSASSTAPTKTS